MKKILLLLVLITFLSSTVSSVCPSVVLDENWIITSSCNKETNVNIGSGTVFITSTGSLFLDGMTLFARSLHCTYSGSPRLCLSLANSANINLSSAVVVPDDNSFDRVLMFNNADQTTVDLYNLPVLIDLNGGNFDYSKVLDENVQIVFRDSTDSFDLNHHIEVWDSSGSSKLWVRVPKISAGSDTNTIIFRYGTEISKVPDRNGTYDGNFLFVTHLNQDPAGTAPQMTDQTDNNISGTTGGSMTTTDSVAAVIGKGVDFEGFDDFINYGTQVEPEINETEFTLQFWAKMDVTNSDEELIVMGNHSGTASLLSWRDDFGSIGGRNNTIGFLVTDSGVTTSRIEGSNGLWDDTDFHLITMTFFPNRSSPGGLSLYFDGVEDSQSPVSTAGNDGVSPFRHGGSGMRVAISADGQNAFNGIWDEVRVSIIERPADWIAATYLSETSNFVTIGAET